MIIAASPCRSCRAAPWSARRLAALTRLATADRADELDVLPVERQHRIEGISLPPPSVIESR
jgi:hypothetical protein